MRGPPVKKLNAFVLVSGPRKGSASLSLALVWNPVEAPHKLEKVRERE